MICLKDDYGSVHIKRLTVCAPAHKAEGSEEVQHFYPKLTVAGTTAAGAGVGSVIGGKKGALIGAGAGAGSSALYTYKFRKRHRRRY